MITTSQTVMKAVVYEEYGSPDVGYHGGFAEYVCTHGKTMMLKVATLTFEQAAAIPQGGVIALQAFATRVRSNLGKRY